MHDESQDAYPRTDRYGSVLSVLIAATAAAQRSKQKWRLEARLAQAPIPLRTCSNNGVAPILVPGHPPPLKDVELSYIHAGVKIVAERFGRGDERVHQLSGISS